MHNALSIDTKIDDLGWPWTAIRPNFLGISHDLADLEVKTAERIVSDCSPLNVLFSDVYYYIDIFWAFRRYGSTIRIDWAKKLVFNLYTMIISRKWLRPRLPLSIGNRISLICCRLLY